MLFLMVSVNVAMSPGRYAFLSLATAMLTAEEGSLMLTVQVRVLPAGMTGK